MAENPVPVRLHDLFTLAEDAADGAHQFEVAIGLKQNDEAAIRAALAAAQTAGWLCRCMNRDSMAL